VQQFGRRERLAQARGRAEIDRHAEEIRGGPVGGAERVAGHDDDRQVRRAPAEGLDRLETVHVGHEDVDDGDVERVGLDRLRAVVAAFRQHDRVTLAFQDALHDESNHRVVIDDQNACHADLPSRHDTSTSTLHFNDAHESPTSNAAFT